VTHPVLFSYGIYMFAIGEPIFTKKGKRHVKTSSRELLKEKLSKKA
jgi:hypothetical protein